MGIAYVERGLDDKQGSRYNFYVKQSKNLDFSIGLQKVTKEEVSEDSEMDSDAEPEFIV